MKTLLGILGLSSLISSGVTLHAWISPTPNDTLLFVTVLITIALSIIGLIRYAF